MPISWCSRRTTGCDTARNNLAAATRVYKLVDERFKVGTASALDTAQQESVVNQVRAALPLLEQQLRENVATLAVLIGRAPAHVNVRTTGMGPIAIPPVTPGLPSDLLTQRPDIRDAEARLAAANANVESARAAMLPSITLTGEGGYASAALRTLMRPESAFFTLAGGVIQPLLDGWRLQGQLDFERGRQDELLQLYRRAGGQRVRRRRARAHRSAAIGPARAAAARGGEKLAPRLRDFRDAAAGGRGRPGHRAEHPAVLVPGRRQPASGSAGPPSGRGQPVPALGGGWPLPPKRVAEVPNPSPDRMKSP